MISLLLTLFISVFSVGSSINSIDDPKENIITDSSIQVKGLLYHESTGGSDSNAYVASNSDILSTQFLGYVYSHFGYNLGSNEYYYDNNFRAYLVEGRYLDLTYPMGSSGIQPTTYSYYCESLSITCTSFSATSYGKRYSSYQINFNYRNQNNSLTSFMTIYFDYFYPEVDSLGYKNEGLLLLEYTIPTTAYLVWAVDNPSFTSTAYNYFYNTDYQDGYDIGYVQGVETGESRGYQNGYSDGLQNANYDVTATTIFGGITSIALVPIRMFMNIFNFEILGINIAGFISGLLTISVVVIIIRVIVGGKNDS